MQPQRSPGRRFLTATWRALAMLNYEVDPALLAARVPAGTELDAWRGRTFVSVVGFRFLRTRVLGVPVPLHRDFDEVNLRFYVRRDAPDGVRRGVVFVKEIVPRRAIAWVARAAFRESYVALPMRHEVALPPANGAGRGRAAYAWRLGATWSRLSVEFEGAPAACAAGSEQEFITEHYWGYVRRPHGATLEYRVEHPPWRAWRAVAASLDCDAAASYGPELAPVLASAPSSAFVAEGSPVVVRWSRPLG